MNNFFRRTLTGAWIVIFIMGGFWLHPISFLITGLILLAGTQYEYYNIIRTTGVHPRVLEGMTLGISMYIISALAASAIIPVRSFLILIPLIILVIVSELYRVQDKPFDSLAHTFFPLIYSAVPFSLFPFAFVRVL